VTTTKWLAAAAAGALALGAGACGDSTGGDSATAAGGAPVATLDGAGSTFAAPIYQQVAGTLKGRGLTINYQGIGSGAGVSQLQAGTVHFAGSDPALAAEDQAKLKGPALQVPIALGAITLSYNLGGVKSGLKLDGATAARIYLGKVTKWNDPAIARLNAGLRLPDEDITVVHRSDSSGTTKGFTQFLAAHSPDWRRGPGVDKDIKWPTGTGAKGNDGVAGQVKQTDGAIGYVEQAYALQNGFTFADVRNRSGAYVAPTLASTSAAGEGLDVPAGLGISTIDAPGAKAYPIVSQTFLDFEKDPCKAGKSKAVAQGLASFARFLTGADGQATIEKLSYAPLPASLLSKAQAAAGTVECNGTPVGGA
jgi:phosphate transport system substrate-binding protein